MNKNKTMVGAVLLVASSLALLAGSPVDSAVPVALAAVAALGLAAGALMIGTSGEGRPV